MQTFLPYPSFARSAAVLDRQRLGKQRVETMQIMTALIDGRGWVNHPATRMWAGHEYALLQYQHAIVAEWLKRGYRDTCLDKTIAIFHHGPVGRVPVSEEPPPWLGNRRFHLSHKSNLLRKLPEHYRQFWPNVPDDIEYVWPSKESAA